MKTSFLVIALLGAASALAAPLPVQPAPAPTAQQQADMLTKALGKNLFIPLRDQAMGHRGNHDVEGFATKSYSSKVKTF